MKFKGIIFLLQWFSTRADLASQWEFDSLWTHFWLSLITGLLLNTCSAQASFKRQRAVQPMMSLAPRLRCCSGQREVLCSPLWRMHCTGQEQDKAGAAAAVQGKGDEGLNWDRIEGTKSVTWRRWN